MKKITSTIMLALLAGVIIIACKKTGSENFNSLSSGLSNRGAGKSGLAMVECYQTLPSTISSSRTLNADSAYLISGCVKVTSGATLTAPAGVVFLGEKSTNGTLIIERGAKLVASGTAMNPVIFTSNQPVNARAPGDWGGLVIAGRASSNSTSPSANIIEIIRACGTITSGQSSAVDNDDSGMLSHVQIHYAGGSVSGDQYPAALLLAAVGNQTNIDFVQITNSRGDGMVVRGGLFNSTNVANYDNYKTDFLFQDGYRGNMQYALSLRLNAGAHDPAGIASNGIAILNNPVNVTNTPLTKVVISNASVFGPAFCSEGSVSADFRNGVLLGDNASGGVFNSIISGWPQGLLINGNNAVNNANSGLLKFSYNSFYDYPSASSRYSFIAPGGWNQPADECVDNFSDWMLNPDELLCANFGIQSFSSGFNFSNTLCGGYCSTTPNFALSTVGSLQNSEYPIGSMVNDGWFNTSAKPRGGFSTATAWTSGWTSFCPQATGYCL